MAKETWPFVFDQVLGHEGGFTDDRRDRGNWTSGKIGVGQLKGTKYGISAMSYPSLDIRNLTTAQARDIYKRDYWDRLKGDRLPEGVDLAAFDYAVNSGVGRAARSLQQLVGVKVDGLIGPTTLDAIEDHDPADLVQQLCAERLDYLQTLATWPTYGKGWGSRVSRIKTVGLQMVKNAQKAGQVILEVSDRQWTPEQVAAAVQAVARPDGYLEVDPIEVDLLQSGAGTPYNGEMTQNRVRPSEGRDGDLYRSQQYLEIQWRYSDGEWVPDKAQINGQVYYLSIK